MPKKFHPQDIPFLSNAMIIFMSIPVYHHSVAERLNTIMDFFDI